MSADSQGPGHRDGIGPPAAPGSGRRPADAADLGRLPPPAFPPGSRRIARRAAERPGAGEGVPEDAFISPDEPMEREGGIPDDAFITPDELDGAGDDAFISPDEPLPPRSPRLEPEYVLGPDEAVVTGIDDDPHLAGDHRSAGPDWDDPDVGALADRVGRLADALRERGEAGLRTTPAMSRFEATLRAYCVGWLAARREGGDGG